MNKFKQLLIQLRSSFWFVPSLIVAASLVLAVTLVDVDAAVGQTWQARWPQVFGVGPEGARAILSTIAGSMITVVGVTFSMTLVTLALAASQYTSRILRNFMRDRVTQVVLGIFAGIFTYCLIVLRTVRGSDANAFVPGLAVTFSVVLAVGGTGVLIFFIHHIASAIQVSNILATVAAESLAAVDRIFPQPLGEDAVDDAEEKSPLPLAERNWQAIPAPESGYLQSVDNSALLHLAREHQTIVRMERGLGEFVVQKTTLAWLALPSAPDKAVIVDVQSAFSLQRFRTVEQDVGFGVRQIVDMALRALSPGINDTTTAVTCVNYLTTILARLAARPIPPAQRYDEGELRVITIGPTFASLVAKSFDQIRESAQGNTTIMLALLGALQTIGSQTNRPARRRVLRDEADWIAELADRTVKSPHDRARLENRLAQVRQALAPGTIPATPEPSTTA